MDELDVNPRIIIALKRAKISSIKSVLSYSSGDLERRTHLVPTDIGQLKDAASRIVLSRHPDVTALTLKGEPPMLLSTGCSIMDQFLGGGIINHGITELAGESAAGKTQLCLQLSIQAQLSTEVGGLNGGTAYICTEDAFPSKRLAQLIRHYEIKYADLNNTGDCIHIQHASDKESLEQCISYQLPRLLESGKIKLVVIDSIAALFRSDYGKDQTLQRSKDIGQIAMKLHRLSHQFRVPVICVNQVSSIPNPSDHYSQRKIAPSLGLTWASVVSTRLMMTRTEHTVLVEIDDDQTDNVLVEEEGHRLVECSIRSMEVVFSPWLPNHIVHYIITSHGVSAMG